MSTDQDKVRIFIIQVQTSAKIESMRNKISYFQTYKTKIKVKPKKYQGVKEFHLLARIGCCNFMVFSPFKVNVTYYHPVNQWLLGATNGNQGQTVIHHQCSETINHL